MKTDRTDLWDEEIFVGDIVKLASMPHPYLVKYGNFKYFGTDRIGVYLESASKPNPTHIMPLAQAKTIIRLHNGEKVHHQKG